MRIGLAAGVLLVLAPMPALAAGESCGRDEPAAFSAAEAASSAQARAWLAEVAGAFALGPRIPVSAAVTLAARAPRGEDARTVADAFRFDGELGSQSVPLLQAAMARLLGLSERSLPLSLLRLLQNAAPPANVSVARYDLFFDLCGSPKAYPARATLSLARPAGEEILLEIDPERLSIGSVSVDGQAVPWTVSGGRLRVDASGTDSLTIEYRVTPSDDPSGYGLLRKDGVLWTTTWPSHCGALFPCNSAPAEGAVFSAEARVCEGETVVGSGQPDGDRFLTGVPVPPYAFAFYVAPRFEEVTAPAAFAPSGVHGFGLPGRATPAVRQAYVAESAWALDFFSRLLGPYAFGDRLAFVEIPADGMGGMEHAAAVALMKATFQAASVARWNAVHETSHHWVGDNLRLADWADFWLSEGFAHYLTWRYYRARDGERAFRNILWEQRDLVRSGFRTNPHALVPPPGTDVRSVFDDQLAYSMGGWILRMMEAQVGQAAFDPMLARWYASHRFEPVATGEFLAFASRETGTDFSSWFEGWNSIRALPTLRGTVRVEGQRVTASLAPLEPLPPGTGVPLRLFGRNGETREVLVTPGEPAVVEAGFPVVRSLWDPDMTLLAVVNSG